MTATLEQGMFDIDSMLAEVNPEPPMPPYTGRAPLHFTVDAFTAPELLEAWDRFVLEFGNFDSIRVSHMWHGRDALTTAEGHAMRMFAAALRCDHYRPEVCQCVSLTAIRSVCECAWASNISDNESMAVTLWHDHAWPGWRDLPAVPKDIRPVGGGITKKSGKSYAWVLENYPLEFQKPGAPVLTERDSIGTRHVPGYSPWGGYDICFERALGDWWALRGAA